MSSNVRRIFVEKKPGFNVEANELKHNLKEQLGIKTISDLRILNRYDVSGISEEVFSLASNTIFSEATVDNVYLEDISINNKSEVFAVEFLPGQYDQRADSAAQCIQLLSQEGSPKVHSAKVIVIEGEISAEEKENIKKYCINTVDSREATLEKPESIDESYEVPENVRVLDNFIIMSEDSLEKFRDNQGLAMSFEDLKFCRDYFKDTEKRNPTLTEIKVIDTYWSDHCRHTTFQTVIENTEIAQGKYTTPIKHAYEEYLQSRKFVYGERKKDICLMDIAVLAMKELKKKGKLNDLDESEEINACSIEIDADIDGKSEKWLVMFKNETHNHPTEIEPFGGAATCIGGCIRDPLSGRTYVYQAMRVTGSGDPRASIEETLPGKLPQRKISLEAAHGYSSYGNQIGLATGQVAEVYDEGYVAKRMEIGAVIAAAPKENVVRIRPVAGDIIILLGGRTGRDGCGGATGSSKEHNENSLSTCGAEVQKGNAPTERKIQRLFRNPEVSHMIKRCNDFGAGGVSVAIGELSEGLDIDLDMVPKKYEGLDGTELSISESQERMAVVVDKKDAQRFIELSVKENLESVIVAKVKSEPRLTMNWRGKTIVDISRSFLDTNGVKQYIDVVVNECNEEEMYFDKFKNMSVNQDNLKEKWLNNLGQLNVCSKKGLSERFDSTIGAGTVLMPFGGKYQSTPAEGMAAKLPLLKGETETATIMTYGYNPELAKWSPFHGAVYAVVESLTKIAACGGDYSKARLTFQEYFERVGKEPERWGKPFSALLGAFYAQKILEIPAIGGKDSMSGTFKDLDVPPTLVSFAVQVDKVKNIISPEFKAARNKVVLLNVPIDSEAMPDFDVLKKKLKLVKELVDSGKVLSAQTIKMGGIAEALTKMSFGNRIGIRVNEAFDLNKLFTPDYGSILLEINGDTPEGASEIGVTCSESKIFVGQISIDICEAQEKYESVLEQVFPSKTKENIELYAENTYTNKNVKKPSIKIPKPKVFIPVFPGTNCEYDSAKAFERAGAETDVMVFNNMTTSLIEASIKEMTQRISKAQIIMLPGGFSAGDEPDGSGKFIAAIFRNSRVSEAVMDLLKNRDGLMLGICNGFQALIKLGLVPFGEIREIDEACPTLTYNNIGRHVSCMVRTKVVSSLSPWFSNVNVGDIHSIPVSHGEGRFVGKEEVVKELFRNGQIATRYVDSDGNATNLSPFNPNGSMYAVEGITSPDGRVLGKMGHSERIGNGVYKNIPGNKDQKIFESGVKYFE